MRPVQNFKKKWGQEKMEKMGTGYFNKEKATSSQKQNRVYLLIKSRGEVNLIVVIYQNLLFANLRNYSKQT